MLTPDQQRALDDAYWNTTRTTNRRSRTDRWARLSCPCGADQPKISARTDLRPTDAAIVAPRFERRSPWGEYSEYSTYRRGESPEQASIRSASTVVCVAVAALERSGLRWNGQFHVVDANDGPDEVIPGSSGCPHACWSCRRSPTRWPTRATRWRCSSGSSPALARDERVALPPRPRRVRRMVRRPGAPLATRRARAFAPPGVHLTDGTPEILRVDSQMRVDHHVFRCCR